MTTPARERAAAVLGVPVAATAAEAAGAFLAALPRHEFVPPGDAVAALNVLADASAPPDPDGETEPGLSVAERVEDFSRRFWSLAPAERAAEWTALSRQARDAAASRLLALQPGLEVATHALSDPDAEEVAVLARELFLLPPRERAVRRNEWLLASAARHAELSRAAAELRRLRPDLAALEPLLLARLESWFQAATFEKAARETPRDSTNLALEQFTTQFEAATTAGKPASPAASDSGWVWIGIVILLLLLRACVGVTSDRPRTDHPDIKVPKITMPEIKLNLIQKSQNSRGLETVISFTPEQVAAFEKYSERGEGLPPPWYEVWERAGRPKAGERRTIPPRDAGFGREP